ncbi:MAG: DUF4886 domain-containing protein [Oscillospiraceae bacterium]|nr:DUF4886 domain-containing protein [Oscillospiraceae bacterium]
MSKKILCLLLAVACVMSMALTGCGKKEDPAGSTGATEQTNATGSVEQNNTESTTESTTDSNNGSGGSSDIRPSVDSTGSDTILPTNTAWKEDGVLKILTIGNSFSVDCMEFVYQIAKAAGVEKIKLGNLYISGCSLEKHLTNAQSDGKAYTFYTNDSGKWVANKNYKMSTAIKGDNWDFVSFQQSSGSSGKADTYDSLNQLLPIVEGYCTNKNVEFMWHMTWAYQGDSTHSSFPDYNSDQMVMYNAIVDAVKTRIVPNEKVTRIIPNGTAVQNARTSYLGDTLTRDGYHMSKDKGRVLAGITLVAATAGIPWDTIDLSGVCSDASFVKVALESARNAVATPFGVTESVNVKKDEEDKKDNEDTKDPVVSEDSIDFSQYNNLTLTLHKNEYWNSTKGATLSGGTDTAEKYFATDTFTKETLPVGSVIVIADGWKYRPEAWKGTAKTSSSKRPAEVSAKIVMVTDAWWGEWTTRAFNIAKKNGDALTDYTPEQISEVFQIYFPKS